MFSAIVGLIILLIPFLLIFCFTNRWRGFLYILSLTSLWHLCLALISQALNIFYYELIFILNALLSIASIIILIKKTNKSSYKFKINYFVIIAFCIIFFELWSVHYFYSGPVSNINEQTQETRITIPYPYFSDEWVGVSLVNYSIEKNALPSGNPLVKADKYNHFSNILIGFFSLVAEIVLLLRLNPLTAYPIMALSSGILICFLVYIILKINGLKNIPTTLGALCVPLIINGSNLPGIWYFLPFTGGLIFFLTSLGALSLKDWKLFLISSFLAIFLYPPITIFIIPSIIGFLINNQSAKNKLKISLLSLLAFFSAAILIIVFQKSKIVSLGELIRPTIIYNSLDYGIASYPIWLVIPFVILPFSLFGLYNFYKKKQLYIAAPITTGLFFWLIYSQSINFFIISYERAVVTSAILLIIAAAFTWNYLINKIKNAQIYTQITLGLKIIIIISFSLIAWSYTKNTNWEKLVLTTETIWGKQVFNPIAPATNYLTNEDLEIFESIKEKQLLSVPWKALVISVVTGNYPLDSKTAFISNQFLSYDFFMEASCKKKYTLAKKHKIDYVYSSAFNCDKFIKENKSSEDLYLYKFEP